MEKKFPSWDSFKAKYPSEQLQRDRFEDLARALFCDRYGIKYGIYQCYNHAGNETNTINDGVDVVGFNAKFFNGNIDVTQITHSIEIAHNRYPDQTKILIYTNAHFGESSVKKEKTKRQEDVENFANDKGITVEWVNDKMILDHVIKVDWIYGGESGNRKRKNKLFARRRIRGDASDERRREKGNSRIFL